MSPWDPDGQDVDAMLRSSFRAGGFLLELPEVFPYILGTSGLLQVASLVLGKLLPAWSFLLVLFSLAMWLVWFQKDIDVGSW